MPAVANNLIIENLRVLSAADDSLTVSGLSTTPGVDFQISLQRQSGSSAVAASETVTIAEVATTGHYIFAFTPQNNGMYWLDVKELDALTLGRALRFPYEVLPAGAVFTPSFTNAFCSQADVERYSGLHFTNATQITSAQVAGFAEEGGAALMSRCSYLGFPVTVASLDPTSRLADILRAANATWAAWRVVIAWYAQIEPSQNDKAKDLLASYIDLVGDWNKIPGTLAIEISGNLASLTTSNVLSGDTTARANEGSPQDIGLQVRMSDLY